MIVCPPISNEPVVTPSCDIVVFPFMSLRVPVTFVPSYAPANKSLIFVCKSTLTPFSALLVAVVAVAT